MPSSYCREFTLPLEPRILLSTTYYVSPSGSDSHAGSSDATAFATLQHAADTVQPGDTVIVRAGSYAHGFELPFKQGATQRIQFLADPGVTITGPSTSGPTGNNGLAIEIGYNYPNSVSASMEPVTISGFTIDGTNKSITDTGIYLMWADGSIIQNNTIHDVGGQGVLAKYSSNILLQYNVAHDCGFNNIVGRTDSIHGIYVTDSCNHPTVRWNTLYHNLDSGLHLNGDANSGLYPQAGDHSGMISNALIEDNVVYNNVLNGMNLDGMQNSVVRNNLCYQNGQLSGHKDITIFEQDAASSPVGNAIYNNTLTSTITTQTHHGINMDSGAGNNDNAVFNNIVYQPWGTNGDAPILIDASVASGTLEDYNAMTSEAVASDGSPHNVAIPGDDPTSLFVNFAALDYHLKAGSIAIDHGIASLNGFSASAVVNGFAPTDLDGNTRPQGGGYDLGAYEFVAATTTPAAPSALAAAPADPVSITLNWTDNSSNESSFLIERSTDGVNFTQIASVAANTTTYTDPALTSGASYSYRVRAANSAGNSSYSNTASAVAPAAPAPPAAPTALSATAAGSSQINLSWSESSASVTAFLIERSTDGVNFTQIATTAANVTTYSNTGLTASTQYTYRVRATNSGSNSAYSNTAAVTTLPTVPAAPSALTATAASTSQINLSWTDNSTNETAFLIERSSDGINFTQIASVPANVTTYSDSGVTSGAKYTYRLRATSANGDSAYSNAATATMPTVSPGSFSIFAGSTVPTIADDPSTLPTEVGVKFKSDVSGTITGIRFYKGPSNTGTHTAHLWTDTGTLLATATFTGESASGWQEVTFSSPVAIQANTVYVASYFAPNGRYAEDDGYFASSGVDNGPLHALKDGVDGPDGAYSENVTNGTFPTSDFSSANYYVDVVFSSPTSVSLMSTTFGDGAVTAKASRSAVRDIALNFDQPITLGSGAVTLSLLNTGGSGLNNGAAATDASVALGTPTTADGGLTWIIPILANTASSDATGSLNDGIYTVTVNPAKVSGGTLSGTNLSTTFHRLYGDIDGNGTVNSADYFKFKAAFGSTIGQTSFNADFDCDGNGKINSSDYFKFKANFGRKFTY